MVEKGSHLVCIHKTQFVFSGTWAYHDLLLPRGCSCGCTVLAVGLGRLGSFCFDSLVISHHVKKFRLELLSDEAQKGSD